MMGKKYMYIDYNSLFVACTIFIAGFCLAVLSLLVNAPGIYPFLFICVGTSGLIVACLNQAKREKYSTECRPLLPTKIYSSYPQQGKAVLKYEGSEIKPLNTNQQCSETQICCLAHPDLDLKPGNLTNSISKIQNNAEGASKNIITCIERDIEHADICHELYTLTPSPGGSSSRKRKVSISEKSQRKHMPLFGTTLKRPVAKMPSSQFYVPSTETTALIPEESDSEEQHSNSGVRLSVEDGSDKDSEEQSRPSSSSDPIYENVDAYRAKPSEYSLESLTKHDFQNEEFQLSEVEKNKLSCDQRAINVESTNSQGKSEVNKNRLKYRVGEFTSPERIYANILPPLGYIHEPASAEHNIPKEIKSSTEDGNIHKTCQPLVKTLPQVKPEKYYSNKTPLEDCGKNGKSAKDFNSNILSYKDSPIKETIAALPPGMQNMEDKFSRDISRDSSTHNKEIKVDCCNRLHPRSPYKNTRPLQEGNINLEVSDSSLGVANTGSNPFKRYEERKSPESENVYENLPCYMLTMFQKFGENTLASFEEKNDFQPNTELQTVATGSITEKVRLAKQVRCDRVAVTETESSTSEEHCIYSERDLLKRKTATNRARSGLIHVNTKGSLSFTSVEEDEESDECTCGDNISPKSCAFDSGSNVYEFDRKSYETEGSCLGNEDARNFAGARSKKFTPHYSTSALEKLGNIPKMKSKSLTLEKQMPLKSVTLKRGNDYENVRRCTYISLEDSQKHIDKHNEAKKADMHLSKTAAAVKLSPIDIENTDRSLMQITPRSSDKTFSVCPIYNYSEDISPLKFHERVENVFYPSCQSNIVVNKDDESSFSFKKTLGGNLTKFASSEHDSKREQSLKSTNPFEPNISRSADISAVTSKNLHPPLVFHKVEDLYPKNSECSGRSILTSPNQSSFTGKSDNYLSFKKYLNECNRSSRKSESHSSDRTTVRTEKNILCTEFEKCSFTETTDQFRPSQRYGNQIFDTLSTGENYPPKIKQKRSPTEKKGFLTAAERSSNQSSFNLARERTRADNRQSHSQLLSVSKPFTTSPQKPLDSRIKSYFPVEDARESQNYAFYSGLQLTDRCSYFSDETRAMKIQPMSPSYTKEDIDPNLTQDKLVVCHYDSPRKPVRCVESRMSQPSHSDRRNELRTDSGNSPEASKMSLEEFVKSYYDSPKELRRVDELKNLKKNDSEIEKRIHSPERHEIITSIKNKVSPLRSPLKEATLEGHYISPPTILPCDSKELRRVGDELKNLKKNDSEIEKRIHSPEIHEIITNIKNKVSPLRSPLKETRLEGHYISPPRIKTPSPIVSPLKSSFIGSEHSPLGTSLSFAKETSPNDGQARFSQDQFAISHYDSPSKLIRYVKFETSPTSPCGKGNEAQIDNGNSQERTMLSFEEFMKSYYDSPKRLQRINEEMSNLEQRESEDKAVHSPDHQVISNVETKKSCSSLKEAKFQSDSISPGKIKTQPRIIPPLNFSYVASSHSSLRVNETSEQLSAPVIENIYENVSSFRRIEQNPPDSSCSTDSSNVSCSNIFSINPDSSSEISTAKRKLFFSVDKNASSGRPDHDGPS